MNEKIALLPGEEVILMFRKHILMLFFDTIGTLSALCIPFVFFSFLSYAGYVPDFFKNIQIETFASALWLLIVWCALAVQWTDYYLDIWIITNTRIINISQIGLFDRNVTNWGIERIQEVTIHTENIVQTFFNYGTVHIQTAGPHDENETASGIPNPELVRSVIMAQMNHIGKLEQLHQEQEELLTTVSHEVKGYLTKDAAALAAIAESESSNGSLKSIAERALKETRDGVAALIHLLNKNRASPRNESTLDQAATFDLKPILTQLVEEFAAVAQKKGVHIQCGLGHGACTVRGDQVALKDLVLRNLIDNAVRYTPHGRIEIAMASDGKQIHFSIEDSGVGISMEDMAHLFEPGGRGTHSLETNPESTGYGLSSAKSVVEAQAGKIWAKSAGRGLGTIFFVELPAA